MIEVQEFRAEVRQWLADNLVGEFAKLKGLGGPGREHEAFEERRAWNQKLAEAGLTCLGWPVEHGGRGLSVAHRVAFYEEYALADAPAKVNHLGEELLGPTLIDFGTPEQQQRFLPKIRDVTELYENLDDRIMAGFGGVAEYGITVRWNKNFLKVIRLLLERRRQFAMYGGVRFGGTLTVEDAWTYGFDHIALCAGAGKPTQIKMPNSLARGVRMASDFLMALQLTGAAKQASIFLRTSSASSYSSRSRNVTTTGASHGTPRTWPGRSFL